MNAADLGHRALWTFIQTFTGVLVAAGLFDLQIGLLHAAAAAAIADVLVVVKEYARHELSGTV
jgi:hypothetical protein